MPVSYNGKTSLRPSTSNSSSPTRGVRHSPKNLTDSTISQRSGGTGSSGYASSLNQHLNSSSSSEHILDEIQNDTSPVTSRNAKSVHTTRTGIVSSAIARFSLTEGAISERPHDPGGGRKKGIGKQQTTTALEPKKEPDRSNFMPSKSTDHTGQVWRKKPGASERKLAPTLSCPATSRNKLTFDDDSPEYKAKANSKSAISEVLRERDKYASPRAHGNNSADDPGSSGSTSQTTSDSITPATKKRHPPLKQAKSADYSKNIYDYQLKKPPERNDSKLQDHKTAHRKLYRATAAGNIPKSKGAASTNGRNYDEFGIDPGGALGRSPPKPLDFKSQSPYSHIANGNSASVDSATGTAYKNRLIPKISTGRAARDGRTEGGGYRGGTGAVTPNPSEPGRYGGSARDGSMLKLARAKSMPGTQGGEEDVREPKRQDNRGHLTLNNQKSCFARFNQSETFVTPANRPSERPCGDGKAIEDIRREEQEQVAEQRRRRLQIKVQRVMSQHKPPLQEATTVWDPGQKSSEVGRPVIRYGHDPAKKAQSNGIRTIPDHPSSQVTKYITNQNFDGPIGSSVPNNSQTSRLSGNRVNEPSRISPEKPISISRNSSPTRRGKYEDKPPEQFTRDSTVADIRKRFLNGNVGKEASNTGTVSRRSSFRKNHDALKHIESKPEFPIPIKPSTAARTPSMHNSSGCGTKDDTCSTSSSACDSKNSLSSAGSKSATDFDQLRNHSKMFSDMDQRARNDANSIGFPSASTTLSSPTSSPTAQFHKSKRRSRTASPVKQPTSTTETKPNEPFVSIASSQSSFKPYREHQRLQQDASPTTDQNTKPPEPPKKVSSTRSYGYDSQTPEPPVHDLTRESSSGIDHDLTRESSGVNDCDERQSSPDMYDNAAAGDELAQGLPANGIPPDISRTMRMPYATMTFSRQATIREAQRRHSFASGDELDCEDLKDEDDDFSSNGQSGDSDAGPSPLHIQRSRSVMEDTSLRRSRSDDHLYVNDFHDQVILKKSTLLPDKPEPDERFRSRSDPVSRSSRSNSLTDSDEDLTRSYTESERMNSSETDRSDVSSHTRHSTSNSEDDDSHTSHGNTSHGEYDNSSPVSYGSADCTKIKVEYTKKEESRYCGDKPYTDKRAGGKRSDTSSKGSANMDTGLGPELPDAAFRHDTHQHLSLPVQRERPSYQTITNYERTLQLAKNNNPAYRLNMEPISSLSLSKPKSILQKSQSLPFGKHTQPEIIEYETHLFKQSFEITARIGVGGGGTVYSGTRRDDAFPVAVKQISKSKIKRWGKAGCGRRVPLELELLMRVIGVTSNVIELHCWFERRSSFVMVMERPDHCIDLFDFINQKGPLNEKMSRTIFKQVIRAVQACHSKGVCHRDVKDENILLNSKTLHVKLIDFGCGTRLKETHYNEFAGTPEFYPPEWYINRSYDGREAAVWSLGILLYTMIEGHVPFQRPKDIIRARLKFARFDHLSLSLIDCIQWMVSTDASKRPTLKELLRHPWITESG